MLALPGHTSEQRTVSETQTTITDQLPSQGEKPLTWESPIQVTCEPEPGAAEIGSGENDVGGDDADADLSGTVDGRAGQERAFAGRADHAATIVVSMTRCRSGSAVAEWPSVAARSNSRARITLSSSIPGSASGRQ